jgi:hypothetical protein
MRSNFGFNEKVGRLVSFFCPMLVWGAVGAVGSLFLGLVSFTLYDIVCCSTDTVKTQFYEYIMSGSNLFLYPYLFFSVICFVGLIGTFTAFLMDLVLPPIQSTRTSSAPSPPSVPSPPNRPSPPSMEIPDHINLAPGDLDLQQRLLFGELGIASDGRRIPPMSPSATLGQINRNLNLGRRLPEIPIGALVGARLPSIVRGIPPRAPSPSSNGSNTTRKDITDLVTNLVTRRRSVDWSDTSEPETRGRRVRREDE